MKDLGQKSKDLYDSPMSPNEQKNKIVYPEMDLPLETVEGQNLKVDDEVEIVVKGRVCGIQDTKWTKRISFEMKEGEVKKTSKDDKSLIEGA
jgi:hypothetical protein